MKNIQNEKWVFDTQVIIYALDSTSPFYNTAIASFQKILDSKNFQGVIALQNILESEQVLVRQYSVSHEKAISMVENIIVGFNLEVISPSTSTYLTYHKLLKEKKGKRDIYDIFLAATILDNGLENIVTYNKKDFFGIEGLIVHTP